MCVEIDPVVEFAIICEQSKNMPAKKSFNFSNIVRPHLRVICYKMLYFDNKSSGKKLGANVDDIDSTKDCEYMYIAYICN
jgi:hypothetical protein